MVGPSHTRITGGTWVNHGRGTTVHALEEEWAQEKALRDREGKLRRDERQKVMEEFERGAAERAAQARAADEKVRAERERIAKVRDTIIVFLFFGLLAIKTGCKIPSEKITLNALILLIIILPFRSSNQRPPNRPVLTQHPSSEHPKRRPRKGQQQR